jgi:hypothetical protein
MGGGGGSPRRAAAARIMKKTGVRLPPIVQQWPVVAVQEEKDLKRDSLSARRITTTTNIGAGRNLNKTKFAWPSSSAALLL